MGEDSWKELGRVGKVGGHGKKFMRNGFEVVADGQRWWEGEVSGH